MICTSSGEYVVAVTGEDKAIRVFELRRDGSLMQISERLMPKRPCAIALTPDDKTILCGDKFGDVYSLPLLGEPFVEGPASSELKIDNSNGKAEEHALVFPAASSRTVHTKKNQEALRNQQRQIRQKKEKKILNFEHQLLLGHVSLLTDLAYVSICERTSPFGHRRDYIITSDRDEHIRVSRGMPQAHIVEGYCQGHTEFISKICIPQTHHQLLVSGGGDNYLLVWDWLRGNLHHRIDIGEQINYLEAEYRKSMARATDGSVSEQPAVDGREQTLAVSGIWSSPDGRIIVTCEGVPALIMFSIDENMVVGACDYIPTKSNVIDLTILSDLGIAIYSMDTDHEPFSTTQPSSEESRSSRKLFGSLNLSNPTGGSMGAEGPYIQDLVGKLNARMQTDGQRGSRLYCYNLENLRKRGYEEEP
ncbi:MAG: hypothetical protein Q9195_001061 [Heterodermia aff. obscurata]